MSKTKKVKEAVKAEEVKEVVETQAPEPVKEEGSFKIKSAKKIKQLGEEKIPGMIKVDLSKPKNEEKDAIRVGETKSVDVGERTGDSERWTLKEKNPAQSPYPLLKLKKKKKQNLIHHYKK